MEAATINSSGARLTREEWIRRGLDAIAHEGGRRMSVDDLVAALGVTKGSFYWHFSGRDEFVEEVLDYWDRVFTREVGKRTMANLADDPSASLHELMRIICEEGHARYDMAIRAWAAQEEAAARCLKRVDRHRLSVVGQLFERMGFAGEELEICTRVFVVYHSLEHGLAVRLSKRKRLDLLDEIHAFLTTPRR